MATIGQFRITKDGYEGTISTLTMSQDVALVPNTNKKNDDSPDYFIKAGQCDLGFARKAVALVEDGKAYFKAFLDDPGFSAPVWAAMFEEDGEAALVWSRPKVRAT